MPKKSIWFPENILPLIGNPHSYSSRLCGIVRNYTDIVKAATPELTESEWLLIMDMLNGVHLDERSTQFLGADIAESGTIDGLAEKWKVDAQDLGQRVNDMPLASQIAIQEVAFRFWSESGIVESYRAKLEQCGANVSD